LPQTLTVASNMLRMRGELRGQRDAAMRLEHAKTG